MGRRTLLLIASILVAALGTALIWLYVQGADTRGREAGELVPALFFNRSAQAGENAQTPGLTITKLVPGAVAATGVTDAAALNGRVLKYSVLRDQILLPDMLTSAGQAGRFPNKGAMALSISEPNRVPADLRQGDIVDVFAYGQGQRTLGDPVVTCVKVRAVGNPTATGGSAPAPASGSVPVTIVTFDVQPDTAKKLYGIVAAGEQPALYDHNPNEGC